MDSRIIRGLSVLAFLATATGPVLGQEAADPVLEARVRVAADFGEWSTTNGPSWHLFIDEETGYAQFIGGGSAAPAFAPRLNADADFVSLAHIALAGTEHLTGVESVTLVRERVKLVPLGLIGSTDKVAVLFEQEVGGLPVFDGSLSVLFDLRGNLLSVQSTAMPQVTGVATTPTVSTDRAIARALEAFAGDEGLPGTITRDPRLGIGQVVVDGRRFAALVWEVDVQWHMDGAEPEGTTYWIDALSAGVLRRAPSIHNFDVGGTVSSYATPGVKPDTASNPEQIFPMKYLRVTSSAGTVHTDVNGNFNYPGATGPLACTFEYYGTFADVDNQAGSNHVIQQSLTGTGNAVLLNPSPTELITAQANGFKEVGDMRDWIRAVDPTDNTADFRVWTKVNLSSTCNAYFDGNSINFYRSGGGCVNTAYSTVITHEEGHWLNILYGTGNGSDGMGEGNSDVFSEYIYDTPIVGEDFCGSGCHVRTGWNTRQFCGDCCPGCYGEVHVDGEVWMGAAWKVRNHLNLTNGNAAGDAIANGLFSAWLNVYNQTQIKSVIETQWLTLDDDDGNIDNGTPHHDDIDQGFRDQGFPGHEVAYILISNVTDLPDTTDETGPYQVDATIVALLAPPVVAADVLYRVDGGAWIATSMTPVGGDDYQGFIPGQTSPASVDYYVRATDFAGNTVTYPAQAPSDYLEFVVGVVTVIYFDDFEGGDNGWTHGWAGGSSNSQDDWQHGVPYGKSGDPSTAYSGTKCWGNDLGPSGWNGAYQNGIHNYLRSPFIDCSLATHTELRYRRWLNVERSTADQARIKVNGTQVYINASGADHLESEWAAVTIDISAIADGNPSVQIEFSLQSNASGVYGGWNLDDFEIRTVTSSGGACIDPINYGQAKQASHGGFPMISWSGTPSETIDNFHVTLLGGVSNQFAILISGDAPDNAPFYGGFRLVAHPLVREAMYTLDFFGDGDVPYPVAAGMSGVTKYFQHWFRDPAHPDGTGVGLSDGLEVKFCD